MGTPSPCLCPCPYFPGLFALPWPWVPTHNTQRGWGQFKMLVSSLFPCRWIAMGLLHAEEGISASSDVLLNSGGQGHVVLSHVALQVVAEVARHPRIASHAIVAQGLKPGAQVHPGYEEDQPQQGIVVWIPLSLQKLLIVHHPGHSQEGHVLSAITAWWGAGPGLPPQKSPLLGRCAQILTPVFEEPCVP